MLCSRPRFVSATARIRYSDGRTHNVYTNLDVAHRQDADTVWMVNDVSELAALSHALVGHSFGLAVHCFHYYPIIGQSSSFRTRQSCTSCDTPW